MKGKHIRKEKKSIIWILITLFVLIGVIFGCFHFKSDDQENLSQYKTILGLHPKVSHSSLSTYHLHPAFLRGFLTLAFYMLRSRLA